MQALKGNNYIMSYIQQAYLEEVINNEYMTKLKV